jgi:FAD/FMN-containing dehydrogenase
MEVLEKLSQRINGEIITSEEECRKYRYNFGVLFQGTPRYVIKAGSTKDISEVLQFANECNIPVAVRGGGFSLNHSAVTNDGILLIVRNENAEIRIVEDQLVEVGAGTLWKDLEVALNKIGLSTPVLTSQLNTTVGGTLATGGYGLASIKHGSQLDQVERVEIVLPNGQIVWCSPGTNPDLFKFALATQGKIGIITRVVLKTVRYRKYSSILVNHYHSLDDTAKSLSWVSNNEIDADYFTAYSVESSDNYFQAIAAKTFHTEEEALAYRYPDNVKSHSYYHTVNVQPDFAIREIDEVKHWGLDMFHLWLVYTVEMRSIREFAVALERLVIKNYDIPRYGRLRIFAGRKHASRSRFPLEACPDNSFNEPSNSFNAFGFGLSFHITQDLKQVERIHETSRQLVEECIKVGGRPYSVNSFELDEGLKRRIYGDYYNEFVAIKNQLDPNRILNTSKNG